MVIFAKISSSIVAATVVAFVLGIAALSVVDCSAEAGELFSCSPSLSFVLVASSVFLSRFSIGGSADSLDTLVFWGSSTGVSVDCPVGEF